MLLDEQYDRPEMLAPGSYADLKELLHSKAEELGRYGRLTQIYDTQERIGRIPLCANYHICSTSEHRAE